MPLGEFALIRKYFNEQLAPDILGVGDDAARLPIAPGEQLVVCKDLLIEGRHYFPDVDPRALGHKSLAVNLSDLAAMGAKPLGCLLGLGIRQPDEEWLNGFSKGLLDLAHKWNCPLVGGDTVKVSVDGVISVTALGLLPSGSKGLLRNSAKVGDDIWISGYLGAAHVALLGLKSEIRLDEPLLQELRVALEWPQPRLDLGQALLGVAHSAIDISDGLLQDLNHVLEASNCGATIWADSLPLHPALRGMSTDLVLQAALVGGDVYELCFTAPPEVHDRVVMVGQLLGIPLTRVGSIDAGSGLRVVDAQGQRLQFESYGFDHFRIDEN